MSISGISSSLASTQTVQSSESTRQQFEQGFRQLGQSLQSGNLAAAQAQFSQLPKPGHGQSSTQSGVPIEQAFGQLSQNLQSGNLSGAQQDFAKIQTLIANQVAQGNPPPAAASSGSSAGNSISVKA